MPIKKEVCKDCQGSGIVLKDTCKTCYGMGCIRTYTPLVEKIIKI
jgi:DnaJ-class molecular chaperone